MAGFAICLILGYLVDPFIRARNWTAPPAEAVPGQGVAAVDLGGAARPLVIPDSVLSAQLAQLARKARTTADEEALAALMGSDYHAIQFIDEFDEELFGPTSLFARYIYALSTRNPEKGLEVLRRRSPAWRQAWVDENLRSLSPQVAYLCLQDALRARSVNESSVRDESVPELIARALLSNPEQTLFLLANDAPKYFDTMRWEELELTERDVRSLLARIPSESSAATGLVTQYARMLAGKSGVSASLEWLRTHSEHPDPETLISGFLDKLIPANPVAVATAVSEEAVSLNTGQRHELVRQLSAFDHGFAQAWVASFPDGMERDQAAAALYASPWASPSERQALIDLAITHSDDSLVSQSAATALAAASSVDLPTARAFAEQLPSGSLAQREAVAASVSAAARWDPLETSGWMARLPPEGVSDSAITSLLDAIPDDPGGALLWSLELDDAQLRLSRAAQYAAAVYGNDPDGFSIFFKTLSLSEDEKRVILESIHGNTDE